MATVAALRTIAKHTSHSVSVEPPVNAYLKPNVTLPEPERHYRADIAVVSPTYREATIIDVRTCSMKKPSSRDQVGKTVREGERAKYTFYSNHFDFPSGHKLVPFAIDSYGRWGQDFKDFLQAFCKYAAGKDVALYNILLSRAREAIAVAHANAVGVQLRRVVEECIDEDEHYFLSLRGGP